jgi:CheY-like chemotaxis protein/DNA-binding XRE family transcriptional regulator
MPDIGRRLGAAIRVHRARLGLSQEEVAFRSDLHRTYVADIERGARNPSLRSITKLAKALQVSVADLFHQIGASEGTRDESESRMLDSLVDILVAEPDPVDADLTVRALRQFNFSNCIHTVQSGPEAVDFIFCLGRYSGRRQGNDSLLLLLDLRLPGLDGIDVLRRVRDDARTRNMSVIVLTSSDSQRGLEESRRLGVCNYLTKPVDFTQFSQIMPQIGLHWLLVKQPPVSVVD